MKRVFFPKIEKRGVVNLLSEEKKAAATSTPAWLKWPLLAIFFISALIGFISSFPNIRHPTAGFPMAIKQAKPNTMQTFFGKAVPVRPPETVLCQGTIISADRGALAIIDGQSAKVGSVVSGVRIIEITASNVLVECNGKTRRLAPGEKIYQQNNGR